ncbi:hypothetical protein NKDENANG_04143 [Candidatus Entotheonellaceae bacterium PAL068K]
MYLGLPILLLISLIFAGCGGDNGADDLEPPAFDLTGTWRLTEPWQCEPEPDIALTVNAELIVMQSNNQLTVTVRPSGDRYEGTISDDQIAVTSHLVLSQGVQCRADINGTVLNENVFAGTQLIDCRGPGGRTTSVCTGELMR